MLNDKHLKVVLYENNASNIFPNTDIKGGVAIIKITDQLNSLLKITK